MSYTKFEVGRIFCENEVGGAGEAATLGVKFMQNWSKWGEGGEQAEHRKKFSPCRSTGLYSLMWHSNGRMYNFTTLFPMRLNRYNLIFERSLGVAKTPYNCFIAKETYSHSRKLLGVNAYKQAFIRASADWL